MGTAQIRDRQDALKLETETRPRTSLPETGMLASAAETRPR